MALAGKLEAEVEVHSAAAKFFSLFVTELHNVQNISDHVHETKVHQGEWHSVGSDHVKHWTYTIGDKAVTCKEHFEERTSCDLKPTEQALAHQHHREMALTGGKVVTCKENFEEIDPQKKSFTINLFDGDVGDLYKSLKVKLHVIDCKDNNNNNGAVVKWAFEYEKLHQDIPPPEPYLDYITKVTKDVDAHLLKA